MYGAVTSSVAYSESVPLWKSRFICVVLARMGRTSGDRQLRVGVRSVSFRGQKIERSAGVRLDAGMC